MRCVMDFNIESMGQLIERAAEARQSSGFPCWFRGHAIAEWKLVASVHRDYDLATESNMALTFRLGWTQKLSS